VRQKVVGAVEHLGQLTARHGPVLIVDRLATGQEGCPPGEGARAHHRVLATSQDGQVQFALS